MDVQQKSANGLVGEVKAMKKKGLNYPITVKLSFVNGKCTATPSTNNFSKLDRVHLSLFKGMSPTSIVAYGLDQSQKPAEDVVLKPTDKIATEIVSQEN
jgi:hypothetical protein